jgi:DNA-directed RNA polymerase subunit alpha
MELKIKCVNTETNSDGSQYGKFVIEPLERGFGTTIGNSLRRVLLSSLEGTAVTSARIEGITHEYTAIPGVLEDVIDVMLNLKGLVVKSDSNESQHLRIDVDKPGPVLASDIQLPAGVKVVNPDWLICTVADGGSFHADVIVDTGKGYVPNDVPRDAKDATIDILPIDATFMPIKRVSYNVESARVGDALDFDKLTIEIWSNGSIDVQNALSQASNLLIEHFMQIAAITGQPVVAPTLPVEEVVEEEVEETPTMTIEELELSVRAYNCLKRASINSMSELLKKSEHDLLNIKNFGKKSSDEVIERLHHFGLDLAPSPVEEDLIG